MISQIAWRNTIKNWRHSLSALLSLAASFVSLVVFDGYMKDVDHIFMDTFRHKQMLGDVIIENSNIFSKDGVSQPWKFWISPDQLEELKIFFEQNKSSIKAINQSLIFHGMASNGRQSFIFMGRGYESTGGAMMRGPQWSWNTPVGMPIDRSSEEFPSVIGFGFAKKFGCEIPSTFPFLVSEGYYRENAFSMQCPSLDIQLSTMTPDGQLNAVDVKLTGIIDGGYKDLDDRFLHTNLAAAQTLMNTNSITYVVLQTHELSQVESLIKAFDDYKKNHLLGPGQFIEMAKWQDHPAGEPYRKTMSFLNIFRNFIIIVIMAVSTLSVTNTMVKIVKERTREIGTLRSIGFKRSDVLKLFLTESFYLAQIGSAVGALLSILISLLINSIQIQYKAGMLTHPILFKIHWVPISYLHAWILLVVISGLASLISTLSTIRGKVVENLSAT